MGQSRTRRIGASPVLHSDRHALPVPRPVLTTPRALSAAIAGLSQHAASRADLWRLVVESFAVDLDALAAMLPVEEPEPVWLSSRA